MKRKIALFMAFALLLGAASFYQTPVTMAATQKPKLNIKKLDMTLGNSFQLRLYNMKKNYKATYTSANPSIVSVESVSSNMKKATIMAQEVGSSTITVKIQRPKKKILSLACRVKISPEAVTIKFVKQQYDIHTGNNVQADTIIKPSSSTEQPIFVSDNPAVATVSPFGLIMGISPGTATITATLLSTNQSATCTVTVSSTGRQRMSVDALEMQGDSI